MAAEINWVGVRNINMLWLECVTVEPIIKLAISGSEHVPVAPIESTPLNAVGTAEPSGNITVAVGASFVGI
jgi:hypothetical protein